MSIHKLYIFSKSRDAIAAQKGYGFQQLKTLEDWLENRVAGGTETIYCDYEDDIFSRDVAKGKAKFNQLKLYATDFSFSSESIKKAVSHFFMLYVKGEYAFDEVECWFETNASIVQRDMRENDAQLLREWYEGQDNLNKTLADKIRVRVKKILREYINEQSKALQDNDELKSQLQQAKLVYDNLSDEVFDEFIRCIKWKFDGVEQNVAVQKVLGNIKSLVQQISLPLNDEKNEIYVSLLVSEVFNRSMQDEPEERKLTSELLDNILLNAGEEEDKWYAETLEQFRAAMPIESFFAGEFHSAISGARYCRWNTKDDGHQSFWLTVLQQYIALENIPVPNRRKAIYEYLFLKIGHDFFRQAKESPVKDDIELIQTYISEWNGQTSLRDIEDDIILLQLLKAQIRLLSLPLDVKELMQWQTRIQSYLDEAIKNEPVADRICELLELRGHLAKQYGGHDRSQNYQSAFDYYRRIIPLLENVNYYSLWRLDDQLEAMAEMLVQTQLDDELVELIDAFREEIKPYVHASDEQHVEAKAKVKRGITYLDHQNVKSYLTALERFHEAKARWRMDYTKEGYILSLLNIAQVYQAMGMCYASKYYALLAFWNAWHSVDPALYKRLPQAIALICHADFSTGSWMSAIGDFHHYLKAKREFDERGFAIDNEFFHKTISEMAIITHAVPRLHPDLKTEMDKLTAQWGFIWTDYIAPVEEIIGKKSISKEEFETLIERKLRDQPLNDVGPVRHIRFNALNIGWEIQFDNNDIINPIAEEFTAFLQIALCEIATVSNQMLEAGRHITITIQKGHFQKEYLGNDNWVFSIPVFNNKETKEIQLHYAYLGSLLKTLVGSLTTLSKQELNSFYINQMLMQSKLGEKALEGTAYQRVFRNSIGLAVLPMPDRASFQSLPPGVVEIKYIPYLTDPVNDNRYE